MPSIAATTRAIVADPNPQRRAIYCEALEAQGLAPLAVADGLAAAAIFEEQGAPRLLITELSLARIDGFELIQRLRRMSTPEAAPALAISAFRELRDEARRRRDSLGISAILPPSGPSDVLHRVIHHLLEREPAAAVHAAGVAEPPAPSAEQERHRLAAIDASGIVNNAPVDAELQSLVAAAAKEFNAPIALISLVLQETQWFMAQVGLAVRETPRMHSFCRHVVEAQESLVVPDATTNPVFAQNPFVLAGTVRGYAGAPITMPDGTTWGTLCVIDPARPLRISAEEIRRLEAMAQQVALELEARTPAKTVRHPPRSQPPRAP